MGETYTTTSITGYNSSPPADDGSSTDANKVKWSTIKTKLPDPLKTAIESINTKLIEAFDTSVVSVTGATKSVGASDNGKLLAFDTTSNAITANLAAAATLGDGWSCTFLLVDATNALTIDPNGSETINGEATRVLTGQYSAVILRSDGTNIHAIVVGGHTPLARAGSLAPHSGLVIKYVSGTTVDVDADEVLVSNGYSYANIALDSTINMATTGVDALDDGTQAAGWYHVWAIFDGANKKVVASTAPDWASVNKTNIGAGYTYYGYLGAFYSTGVNTIRDFHQINTSVVTAPETAMAAGTDTSFTSVSGLTTLLPTTATEAQITAYLTASTTGSKFIQVASSSTLGIITVGGYADTAALAFRDSFVATLITAQTLYYKVDAATTSAAIFISGWKY